MTSTPGFCPGRRDHHHPRQQPRTFGRGSASRCPRAVCTPSTSGRRASPCCPAAAAMATADPRAFESDLRREGFEVIHGGQKPDFSEDMHAHDFDVRIMVLAGEITVTRDGRQTFRSRRPLRDSGGLPAHHPGGPGRRRLHRWQSRSPSNVELERGKHANRGPGRSDNLNAGRPYPRASGCEGNGRLRPQHLSTLI